MEVIYFDELESTHTYLKDALKAGKLHSPIAVVTDKQTAGVGSRGNAWHSNPNSLFLSFVINSNTLDKEIETQSYSIYFAYLALEVLREFGSSAWMKWPNDLYLKDKKIGGVITNLIKNEILVGIGINFAREKGSFEKIDIDINREDYLKLFFDKLESNITWRHVIGMFREEFHKSRNSYAHIDGVKTTLENATLNDDGSVDLNGVKIYSLR